MNEITITWPTNYNGKMACDYFLHIDLAPRSPLPESKVLKTVINIHTSDGSHSPVKAVLVDLCRMELGRISHVFSYPSHGQDFYDFYRDFKLQNPLADASTPVAIYFYKKIPS